MATEEELKNMNPEEIETLRRQNCIFCKIGSGEIPSKKIYEDDLCIAFLDIQPLTFGHAILTTKQHYVFFSQVPDNETKHIFKVAKQISQSMLKALQVKGTNIFIANGELAGQMAPHFLVHIIPRKEEDNLKRFHPQKNQTPKDYLIKVQDALINRIDDSLKTNMKEMLLGAKNSQEAQKTETKESKPEIKDNLENENTNDQSTKSDDDKVDLDKIADMFK